MPPRWPAREVKKAYMLTDADFVEGFTLATGQQRYSELLMHELADSLREKS